MSVREVFPKYRDFLEFMAEDVAFSENDGRAEKKRLEVYVSVYDILVNEVEDGWCIHKEVKLCMEESKIREEFRPEKASAAFCHIERYILFILLKPWKQEYRRIKKYSGFYQNEIENSLSKPESILRLAGFKEVAHGVLVFTKSPKPELLKYIAFECFVASTEFKIIAESSEKIKLSKQSKFKLMYGDTKVPETDTGKYNAILAGNVFDGIKPTAKSIYKPNLDKINTEHHRTRLEGYMKKAQKLGGSDSVSTDFPFMDEVSKQSMDFEEGTLEDHVKASLQVVENNESTPTAYVEPVQRHISASQEWSFVHEGLKQKFGNQYFQGPRKDILDSDDRENISNDTWPGRIQKDIPNQSDGHYQKVSVYDSAYHSSTPAQFPPSIPSDKQILSRSASAVYGRKSDSDMVKKKSNVNPPAVVYSSTAPLLRRTSAPGKRDPVELLSRQSGTLQICERNEQGIDTIQRELNNLSKETSTGRGVFSSPHPVASVTPSSGRYSGMGENSSFTGKCVSGSISTKGLTEYDGYTTEAQAQIPNAWPCLKCTYLNDCSSNVCRICSKTRDGQLETDLPSVGSTNKVCDKCTLENDCKASQCQACGSTLKGSQTVV